MNRLKRFWVFWEGEETSYQLTHLLFFKILGLVYLVAFLVLSHQVQALIGEKGLLPARRFLLEVGWRFPHTWEAFYRLPTLFWWDCGDTTLVLGAYLGVVLSLLCLAGITLWPLILALWFLYLSFYHVGQIFYGYGWEILLLETTFLAIFLCPLFPRSLRQQKQPPKILWWAVRWILFRVMLGAGLIKIRSYDSCWLDLTCMDYHYETQPIPNPLSWWAHQLPPFFHRIEGVGTLVVELIVPWMIFGPRRARIAAGLIMGGFQVLLILSGNLSWLNWLTLCLCVSCLDDRFLGRFFRVRPPSSQEESVSGKKVSRIISWAVVSLIAYLSVEPVVNLFSPFQAMNNSYNQLHLVNTYGAFGTVGKVRNEIIIEGTRDATVGPQTVWREYEFKCKPGNPQRLPCLVSPYHFRLDWQIWFAAMSDISSQEWLLSFFTKVLEGNSEVLSLLEKNPFPEGPPKFIRADLYEYRFTRWGDGNKGWWKRERKGSYFPPHSLEFFY